MLVVWNLFSCSKPVTSPAALHVQLLPVNCSLFWRFIVNLSFLSDSLLQLQWGYPFLRSFLQRIRKGNTMNRYPISILLFFLSCVPYAMNSGFDLMLGDYFDFLYFAKF